MPVTTLEKKIIFKETKQVEKQQNWSLTVYVIANEITF